MFHIDPSRSSDVLKAILTETFGGVVGSDYFSACHKYLADCGVLVQSPSSYCLLFHIDFKANTPKSLVSRPAEFLYPTPSVKPLSRGVIVDISPLCYDILG